MTDKMPDRLEGRYFPAGGSLASDAWLEDRGEELAVIDPVTREEARVVFQELGDRLGSLPRKIYFTDGSVFECADNDAVDLAFGKDKHFFTRLTKAEGSRNFIVFAVVATFVAILAIYRWGLPAMASAAAWATPTSAVALIDSNALTAVDSALFGPTKMSEADQGKYRAIFEELVKVSGHEDLPFQLHFRDGGRLGANAIALPGGSIILTDQLEKLAEHEDEIAGVLAHEIGHVTERHSLRQIYRALGIAFMAAIIIGDTSQLIDNVVGQAALLDTLSYSRQFEHDADEESVEIMLKTGRDPLAFVDLIDRVFEEAGVDSKDAGWLSTHPGNENRRENVEQVIERLGR